MTLEEEDWDTLIYAIAQGHCVLFLGPDISLTSQGANGGKPRPVQEVLADRLNEKLNPAEETASPVVLPLVSELYSRKSGRIPLETQVAKFYKGTNGLTSDVHEDLAKLPFRLCVSTTLDRFFATALEKVGKEPCEEFFNYKGGKQAHITLGDDPNQPTIYQLFGHASTPPSLVLTENDLLKFLTKVVEKNPALPDNLVNFLRDEQAVFLFLGFGLYRWHLRILLRVLDQGRKDRKNNSFAIEDRSPYEDIYSEHDLMTPRVFFKLDHRIGFGDMPVNDFIKTLISKFDLNEDEHDESTSPTKAPESLQQPLAFLSHDGIDKDYVLDLGKRLRTDGIATWIDQENIQGGSKWEDQFEPAIQSADYFLFVQSSKTETSKLECWWRPEIEFAKARAARFPKGFSFLIPVRVDECDLVEEVGKYQRIDVFDDNGYEQLRKTITRDWSRRVSEGYRT